MKTILLLAICLQIAIAAAIALRPSRDVNQMYLPPAVEGTTTAAPQLGSADVNAAENQEKATEAVDNTKSATEVNQAENVDDAAATAATVLGKDGYVYKTVRRLRYRQRRDVSHLQLNRDYLPPHIRKPVIHYLPPPVESAPQPPNVNNEYLPPPPPPAPETSATTPPVDDADVVESETEAPTTEAPTTTTTAPEAATTLAPLEPKTTTIVDAAPMLDELVDDTAILAEDGYHYKRPDVIPDLSPVRDYLPPLEEVVIVDEGESPDNDVASVLVDDGYHYRRAIRRFRF